MEPIRTTLDSTDGQVATVSRTSSPPPLDVLTPPVVAEYWCHTQVRVTKMKYVWTISNFSFCREEMGEVVKSSFFSCGPNDKLRWCLRINPKGLDEESREYLSLYLLLVNCGTKSEARAKFKFSILNAKREETKAMESQRAYRFVQGKDWGFKKFIRRDVLMDEANGLLPNDRLTILCEISVVGETLSDSGQVNNQPIIVPECNLHEDIGSLWFRQILTDVTLVVLANVADKCQTPPPGSAYSASRSDSGKKYVPPLESAGEGDEEEEEEEADDEAVEEEEEDDEDVEHDEVEETDEFDEADEADEENMENESDRDDGSQSLTQFTESSGRSSHLRDEAILAGHHHHQTVVAADRDEAEAVAAFISTPNEPPMCSTVYSLPTNPVKQQPVSPTSPATTSASVPLKGVIIPLGRPGPAPTENETLDRIKTPAAESVNVSSATHTAGNADWLLASPSCSNIVAGPTLTSVEEIRCDSCGRSAPNSLVQNKHTDPRQCRGCLGPNPAPSTSTMPSTTSTPISAISNLVTSGLCATDLVGSTSNDNSVTKPSARMARPNGHSGSKKHSTAHANSAEVDVSTHAERSQRRRSTTVVNTSSTSTTRTSFNNRSARVRSQRNSAVVKPVSSINTYTAPTQSTAGGSIASQPKGPAAAATNTTALTTTCGSNTPNNISTCNGSAVVLKQFEAHKAILAARSPVFAAMFEHGMEESRANRVEITDMEPDTLAEVLRYIYTGHVVGLDKLAHDLLAAADKYQLERLKTMCEEALVESLTTENCCDILVLADMHNAEQLKSHTLEFIMLHAHDICETEGYEQLVRHRPRLLTECFRSLAAQQLPLRCSARKRPRQS